MAALILLGLMSPLPALADCTSPAGVEADMYYNTTHKRVQYCDGTNWVNMGVSSAGSSDNLGNHTATQALAMANFKITGLATPTATTDAVTKAYVDGLVGGGDNLGNHTATQNVQLGSFWINGDSGNEGLRVDSVGRVQIDQGGDGSTYDIWIQGDASTTAETRNLALLGNEATDTLYLNHGGDYTGGTVIGGVISGNGSGLTTLNATNLASGTVPTARLGSGTANATTYLRGDGTWDTPSSALPALTSANIWVGNGSNVATALVMSGDATITNAGVVALAANSVTTAEITDSTIAAADIAAGAVATSEILDGTIITADLADDSVTAAKIATPGTTTTFLRGDGTWAAPTFTTGSRGLDVFTSTGTWVVPANVTWAKATLIGGGGGGARSGGSGLIWGGGAGAFIVKWIAVTPGASMTVTIGAAGAAAASSNTNGTAGGDTIFGSLTAQNGAGGVWNSATAALGGVASGGDINISGGNSGNVGSGNGGDAGQFRPEQTYGNGGRGGSSSVAATAGRPGFAVIEW